MRVKAEKANGEVKKRGTVPPLDLGPSVSGERLKPETSDNRQLTKRTIRRTIWTISHNLYLLRSLSTLRNLRYGLALPLT